MLVQDIGTDKDIINLANNREVMTQSKVAGDYASIGGVNKITIIPDIYDNIGIVLRDMRADRGTATTFTTREVYPLYVQRYPDDEKFMEKRGGATLWEYLPGMVSDYSKYEAGSSPDRPAIQRLGPRTYRFV